MIVTVGLLSKALPFEDAISELMSRILDTIERVSSNDEQLMTVRRRIQRIQVDLEPVLRQTCRPGRAFHVVSTLQRDKRGGYFPTTPSFGSHCGSPLPCAAVW
eukprot:755248-Hanusia_phi.AAC.9